MELTHLSHTIARWRTGEVDDPSYTALYFLHWQAASHGKRFASRRYKHDPRPNPSAWYEETAALARRQVRDYLLDYFERYQFFGIIGNVPTALAAWLRGDWPLTLCEHIPTSAEVLKMQVEGTRPVTVLSSWPRMLKPVLSKPNAFAFLIHDLEHAWKFFHNPDMHRQQKEFFCCLLEARANGQFDTYLNDAVFSTKFDYLISDMNTHTMHASQFLRAILVEFHLRREVVHHPNDLSQMAKDEVSNRMIALLGMDWVAEVEKRMIQPDSNKIECLERVG